ncbi:hypothetical protein Tco_0510829 [Tanacetum coccineum]
MKNEESLNVTFDESIPKPMSSSLVEDDRIDEPIVHDLNGSLSLQVNVSDEGYLKSVKEARGHPIKQVIVGSPNSVLDNEMFEILSNESDLDVITHPNDEEFNSDNVVIPQLLNDEVKTRTYNIGILFLSNKGRNMLSSINEAIKLMLTIATNMSHVIENIIEKQESKDNIKE